MRFHFLHLIIVFTIVACEGLKDEIQDDNKDNLFNTLTSSESGISFRNTLTENDALNYFTYGYMYMGGGVAVGDLNNDGLADLYFTGNMVQNRLYLNKGGLKFEDITLASNTDGDERWVTGVTMADVNNDGLLDIYVSVSGKTGNKQNQLYVNQGTNSEGIPEFIEKGEEFGIADSGQSTQSTFFDYDLDGDLDLYVANYPITYFKNPKFYYSNKMRTISIENSDHFYRNNGHNTFSDVTEDAGLLSHGLSLSATVGDFNQDGYPDIYVSNDFASPDYMYFNNGDGTFSEKSQELTKHTSFYGMGVDIADFNNDGLLDIMQVDMTPEDNRRSKANMASMDPDGFQEMIDLGLHYQYMKNSLQLNNGLNADGYPIFSDISYLSGIANTDWSWACLFADLDNDGYKDIFVTNGSRRDINNKDYFNKIEGGDVYFGNENNENNEERDNLELVNNMPSESIDNYVFRNNGDLTFSTANQEWGLSFEGFSNGATYADLDNDGDLEIIINNIDDEALIFENLTSQKKQNNYIKFELKGPKENPFGLGTKITIEYEGVKQFHELTLTRGFQSSVEPIIHFGLGKSTQIEQVSVIWPDGKQQLLNSIEANKLLQLKYSDAEELEIKDLQETKALFTQLNMNDTLYEHVENNFNDYNFQVLLPHKMSNFGPALAVGDANGDRLDDFYVGGSAGSLGVIFIQNADGQFTETALLNEENKSFEDLDAVFFDADMDGDLDLYIVSGGNEYDRDDKNYQDRLYLNENDSFIAAVDILPGLSASGSCVKPFDYDQDGDLDLFVGGRLDPRNYPFPGKSFILENKLEEGKLKYENVTQEIASELSEIGMVTDGLWTDFNSDGQIDLIVVGEWMPIKVLVQSNGTFQDHSDKFFNTNTTGWWFSLDQGDFDNDGDVDYVFGNMGLNYKYQARKEEAFAIYADDFDGNQKSDIVLSYHNSGEEYPVRGRQCSSQQIPAIQNEFKDYNSFAVASMEDIFGTDKLDESLHYEVESFESIYLENLGDSYESYTLPLEAQISSINDWVVEDYNDDGNLDLILAGGLYASEIETPRSDAGIGLVLLGDGNNHFNSLSLNKSGLLLPHDTKKLQNIQVGNKKGIIVANNQGPLQIFIENN